jgi:multidrug efflux pump subunit AcrA (membrane-fusion protein)
VLVHVPETVAATFILVPLRGIDPVRAARSGVVSEVRAAEGQDVSAGEILLTIASPPLDHRAGKAEEAERALREKPDRARIPRPMPDKDRAHGGNQLEAVAPCAGILAKLAVRSNGALVQTGDAIAEIVCDGEPLQAELTLPQAGMALVRPGQPVKLLYDAFPYQRYGVRSAKIRWVSRARAGDGYRAFAELESDSFVVGGERRPVVAGMGGRARVVVGRRALVSYAFEPLRQLRESLTAGTEQ